MYEVLEWKMRVIKNFLDQGTTDPQFIADGLELDSEHVKEAIAIHLHAEELCKRMLSSERRKREEKVMADSVALSKIMATQQKFSIDR
jgi:hypothetical protein